MKSYGTCPLTGSKVEYNGGDCLFVRPRITPLDAGKRPALKAEDIKFMFVDFEATALGKVADVLTLGGVSRRLEALGCAAKRAMFYDQGDLN